MKSTPLIFVIAFAALSASWGGFVLAPQLQLGHAVQTNMLGSGALYPPAPTGLAHQGADVYRANGCVYCHSQQAGQDGTHCEIVLTDLGTNAAAALAVLAKFGITNQSPSLPETVTRIPAADVAAPILKEFTTAGAKAEVHIVPFGPDIARGWGKRRSVAQDYLYDYPVQLGARRAGPDLSNIGMRQPDVNWHLRHLYAPETEVKGSMMPPYRYLFEVRKIGREPSPDALQLPPEAAPPAGYEVVPKTEAVALATYLANLRADAPLYEAPTTPVFAAPPATNAPAETTNAPAATAAAK